MIGSYNYFSFRIILSMRHLKKKISCVKDVNTYEETSDTEDHSFHDKRMPNQSVLQVKKIVIKLDTQPIKRKRRKRRTKARERNLRTKNIVKNYGKAIASFAVSGLATPYLTPLCEEYKISSEQFVEYVINRKEYLNNIGSFRSAFLAEEGDSDLEVIFKKVFQQIAIIFVKYFSVNWIYSGKLLYKKEHLDFRGKILRRIQNPESFTYLKAGRR